MIRTKRVKINGVVLDVTYAGNEVHRVSTTQAVEITALLEYPHAAMDRIRCEVLGEPATETMTYEDFCAGVFDIPTPRAGHMNRSREALIRLFAEPKGGAS